MYSIPFIKDQFDVIDFSDNEIKKLDNFPSMKRLNAVIINNNNISRVGKIGDNASNITVLILTNNRLVNLSEIDNIATLSKLQVLSLLENQITSKENYRHYTIFKIPSLKLLDFRKVTKKERESVSTFFQSEEGQIFIESMKHEQKIITENGSLIPNKPVVTLTEEQKNLVKTIIESAKTREEVDFIEKQLKVYINLFLFLFFILLS
jgi:U2 small nuclear ribonucleoprotein A'